MASCMTAQRRTAIPVDEARYRLNDMDNRRSGNRDAVTAVAVEYGGVRYSEMQRDIWHHRGLKKPRLSQVVLRQRAPWLPRGRGRP
jgi:hypothetical protein